jgi:hypothetical protein
MKRSIKERDATNLSKCQKQRNRKRMDKMLSKQQKSSQLKDVLAQMAARDKQISSTVGL